MSPELKQQIIGLAGSARCVQITEIRCDHGPVWLPRVPSSVTTQSAYCVTTWLSTKASWNPCAASKMTLTKSVTGMECGIGVKNYNDVRCVGDMIEVFEIIEIQRSID